MSIGKALADLALALDRAGIPWMVTGSVASGVYGVPRGSQDVDLVIEATDDQLRSFVASLPRPRYYADLNAALDARRRESMFNVIDVPTGWKFDLIIKKSGPYSRAAFDRRQPVDSLGIRAVIATAEDVIIAKLEWARKGGSHRQLEDVAGILRKQSRLDRPYLDLWIGELRLETQWRAACDLARPASGGPGT